LPDSDNLKCLIRWSEGNIRLLTIAAELLGATRLARCAAAQNICVSIGHSLFDEETLDRAVAAGAKALTHLGNGLPDMLPRHHNPIWVGLANDRVTAMMIADGHHLPPSLLKTFLRAKGPQRLIVVSDASPLAGLSPGEYKTPAPGRVILEQSGKLHCPARNCLAGSSATLLQCMNYLAALRWCGLDELLALGYRNPLRLIGIHRLPCAATQRIVWNEAAARFTPDFAC